MSRGEPLIRQWNLLKVLQAHRFGIDLDELGRRLECSTRQVLRDLAVLQQVGFPVLYEVRGFGKKFWKLSPQFIEKEGLVLSVTETLSLFLSQQLLAPLTGTELGSGLASALEKIKTLLPQKALDYFSELDDQLFVKAVGFHDYSNQEREIRLLQQAVREQRVVELSYRSAGENKPLRARYHPYGLIFYEGSLYCLGRLDTADAIRTLKVDRIEELQPTGEPFDRPKDFSLRDYVRGSFGIYSPGQVQRVRVRLTGWAAMAVRERRWHESQAVVRDKDDVLTVEFELADTTEFRRWVLGFGRQAVVESPADLARDIQAELQAACDAYSAPAPERIQPSREKNSKNPKKVFSAPLL